MKCPTLCLLFGSFLLAGCASHKVMRHDVPRVVSEGEERLIAEAESLAGGAVGLRVFRECERQIEQDYWFERARSEGAGGLPSRRVASSTDNHDAVGWAVAVAAATAIIIVVGIVAQAVWGALSWVTDGILNLVSGRGEITTIRRTERFRRPSVTATVEPAGGGALIDLGPQPVAGWVLSAETVGRLGGRGALIVVRDGDLSAEVRLDPP